MIRIFIHALPLLSLVVLSACGKAKPMPAFDTGSAQPGSILLPADGSNIMGRYKGEFITLNTNVNGFLNTSALIIRKDNRFSVSLKLIGGAPHTWHKQDIYSGTRCPMDQDDLNKDGFIDVQEGNSAWGSPVVSLDADLGSQRAGNNLYPVSDKKGNYTYRRFTKFDEFMKNLNLSAGFPLEGNVLVILGTHEASSLPETVASLDGLDRHKSFPIACALITKINSEDVDNIEADEGNLGNSGGPRP